LLAAGVAWGEWGVNDLQNPAIRRQIAHASGNIAPPEHVPQGLERLSNIWTAPMPNYAPPFMHNANFGYVMSAFFGAGLIILVCSGLSWVYGRFLNSRDNRA
jgi:cobalt/nickel transport system permease protein